LKVESKLEVSKSSYFKKWTDSWSFEKCNEAAERFKIGLLQKLTGLLEF